MVKKPLQQQKDTHMNKAASSTPAPRKRGNGPIKIKFHNRGNLVDSRPEETIEAITFVNGVNGKEHRVEIGDFKDETVVLLAAKAIANQVDTFVRNHFEDEDEHGRKPDISDLIAERIKELVEGKVYARGVGTGETRKAVDLTQWVDAYEDFLKGAKFNFTPATVDAFRARLQGMTGLERNRFLVGLEKKYPAYKAARHAVAARMAKEASKSVKASADDVMSDFS